MSWLVLISFLSLLYYAWTLLRMPILSQGFKNSISGGTQKISIIIPYLEANVEFKQCLDSIAKLKMDLNTIELICVYDGENQTLPHLELSSFPNHKHIKNLRKGKKKALETGVEQASNNWIVFTDADVQVHPEWLNALQNCLQDNCNLVIAPVCLEAEKNILGNLQLAEHLALQRFTYAFWKVKKPMLCNGANLAVRKSWFLELNPYESNLHIASGDDVFLLFETRKRKPESIVYCEFEEAIVTTKAKKSYAESVKQRLRWAEKINDYSFVEARNLALGLLIINILFVVNLIISVFDSFQMLWFVFLKIAIDISFIYPIKNALASKRNEIDYFVSGFVYPFYFLWVLVRLLKRKTKPN